MKTVIITGANGNLGSAVVNTFLQQNYKVVAVVYQEINRNDFKASPRLEVAVVDLADEAGTETFVKGVIEKHGQVHAALCLAGGFAMGDIAETSSKDIDKQVALNFKTAYHLARPLLAHMKEAGYGRLVFIGSRPALKANQGKKTIAYGLSKSLLFKLAEYINEDAKGKNITATVIAPSTLDTPENRKSMPDADFDKWVKPGKLAEVLEFVVNEKSDILRETILKAYNEA